MAKIQNIGVGNYIRNPRGRHEPGSQRLAIETLKVYADDGNGFLCYPVKDAKAVPPALDTTRYFFIPIDTNVEQVTI